MHRVVTKRLDHRGNWIVELGPWHVSRHDAENWAEILRHMGYVTRVEGTYDHPGPEPGDDDLLNALSSMA